MPDMKDTFCHSFLQCFSMTHAFIKTQTPTGNEQVLFLASKTYLHSPIPQLTYARSLRMR